MEILVLKGVRKIHPVPGICAIKNLKRWGNLIITQKCIAL